MPNQGFVPDAITAQKIAEAVLAPVYGKEAIASEQPFRVTLKNNTLDGHRICSMRSRTIGSVVSRRRCRGSY
jgi:hypothetical protein